MHSFLVENYEGTLSYFKQKKYLYFSGGKDKEDD